MSKGDYNTLIKMNRPILFWGLRPIYVTGIVVFSAISVIIMVFKKTHPFIMITIIIGMIALFILLFSKLKEHQKKGNPDFFQGYFIKTSTPRKIIDKHTFKTLIRKR